MIHDSDSRVRLRRGCVAIGLTTASWSLLTFLTGGISLPLFSSRNPRNPALAAALLLCAAWALATPGLRREHIAADLRWLANAVRAALKRSWHAWRVATEALETSLPSWTATALALAIAIGVVVTSIEESAFVAGASDSWGYVSQAHMWATGTLRTPQPLMEELSGFLPRDAMAPLAYRPSPAGATIVPVTSPGLPMLMALFEVTAGRQAVFVVVPLLAAIAVFATYLLGLTVSDRWTGVLAAAFLATSPAFLYQLTSSPMSDVAASAFWTLSLVCALREPTAGGSRSALSSGITAGIAVLIRANLAPIALVPAVLVAIRRSGPGPDDSSWRSRLLWFSAGVVPAGILIAALFTYWYGSPLNSGYGTLERLYSAGNLRANLTHYSQWLWESQTPVILAALVAPFLVRQRKAAIGLLAFVAAVVACYVFYIPFDAWWYLRFLLPAFPALFVLTAASLTAFARWLPQPLRTVTMVVMVALIAQHTVAYAAARATFDTGGEQKYAITGRYVAEHLPRNAVIFAEQHSGGVRYYGNRTTIRFGLIPSDHLEGTIAELQRLGYRPYFVGEDWEEDQFRRQFAGRQILTALENGPEAELPLGVVRIYPLAR